MATPKPITQSAKAYKSIFDKQSGIFGDKYSDLVSSLEDFTKALDFSSAETSAMDIATGTIDDFEHTMGILNDLLGISMEGAETGFRQDIAPLIPQAQSMYRDFIGEASSAFANSNILNGSDFQGSLAKESGRLSENLTARQFEENVRAAQARGDWTNLAQNLNVLTKSFPLAYSADLYGMGEKQRKSEEEMRGRPFAVFQSLTGLENQTPYFYQGYNTQSSSAANLNALSQALSSMSSNFSNTSLGDNSGAPDGSTPGFNPNV